MADCVSRAAGRALTRAICLKSPAKTAARKLQNFLNVPSSTTVYTQKRTFTLPLTVDAGILGVAAYYLTKLKRPDPINELSIFGPDPNTTEGKLYSKNLAWCIAERGASSDAPENTLEAFKYCIQKDCKFIQVDVRCTKDGQLVLLHDVGLNRLIATDEFAISDVEELNWEQLKVLNISVNHPKRYKYPIAHLCLLDDALDYLLSHKAKVILDIKTQSKKVIDGILNVFSQRGIHDEVAVSCYNPLVLYQIRRKDKDIVTALTYQPYILSSSEYNVHTGPTNYRFFDEKPLLFYGLWWLDQAHMLLWRKAARWCGASAVLLHKDIVTPCEIKYWRDKGVRCIGFGVNRPIEKLYWKNVLNAPYIASTLAGEAELDHFKPRVTERNERLVDSIVEQVRVPT